ncbi:MAG: hypothetical protein IPM10_05570 [Chitinophagaceae bacterium]|nr:hypothetical protein [Chitinophagaceae bacterium]
MVEDTGAKKSLVAKTHIATGGDVRQQKLSVFSPLGVALLGFKKRNDHTMAVAWWLKNLKILNVINA